MAVEVSFGNKMHKRKSCHSKFLQCTNKNYWANTLFAPCILSTLVDKPTVANSKDSEMSMSNRNCRKGKNAYAFDHQNSDTEKSGNSKVILSLFSVKSLEDEFFVTRGTFTHKAAKSGW